VQTSFEPIDRLKAQGARVLVYAGGFDATKNVLFLLETMRALRSTTAVLCLAGDPGRSLAALRQASPEHGRTVFLGRLADEDLAAAYRSADLFVSASLYEGFGLPALEAMACGCPVVALTAGTVPEVLEGAALGVVEKDPDAFASAVRSVLEDASLRASLAAKGLARAAELSWRRTALATSALYHELAGKPASSGHERSAGAIHAAFPG